MYARINSSDVIRIKVVLTSLAFCLEMTTAVDKMNITLAFEPADMTHLSSSVINVALVNDSAFSLRYIVSGHRSGQSPASAHESLSEEWIHIKEGVLPPQEIEDVLTFSLDELTGVDYLSVQALAATDKQISVQPDPIDARIPIEDVRLRKSSSYQPGVYFDTPVIETPLVVNGKAVKQQTIDTDKICLAMGARKSNAPDGLAELMGKYNSDFGKKRNTKSSGASNPHKVLPTIEVDLHIGELVDSTTGLDNSDMLGIQLDVAERTMSSNRRRIGQKIVFIHGKGEGVLRNALLKMIRRKYPKAGIEDASFQKYGFGATEITIH